MRDELAEKVIKNCVALRPKIYSWLWSCWWESNGHEEVWNKTKNQI